MPELPRGIPEILWAHKEMIAPTNPYTARESRKGFSEIPARVKNAMTYAASPLAAVIPGVTMRGLQEELREEAKGFSGFGSAYIPAAGKSGKAALIYKTLNVLGKVFKKVAGGRHFKSTKPGSRGATEKALRRTAEENMRNARVERAQRALTKAIDKAVQSKYPNYKPGQEINVESKAIGEAKRAIRHAKKIQEIASRVKKPPPPVADEGYWDEADKVIRLIITKKIIEEKKKQE
jgi:hypothetical protein